MSAAQLSNGCLFSYNTTGSTYVVVPLTKNIQVPSVKTDLEDVSTHDTPGPPYFKQWLAAMSDGNTLAISGLYRSSNAIHQDLQKLNTGNSGAAAIVTGNFMITFPGADSAHSIAFSAYVDDFKVMEDIGKAEVWNASLKCVGAPVFT